jgi:hypothetical protein
MTEESRNLTLFLIRRNPILWTRIRKSIVPCCSLSPSCLKLYPNIWKGHEEIRNKIIEKFKEDNPELLMEYFMLGDGDE